MTASEDSARYYARHKTRIRLAAKHRRRTNIAQAVLEDSRKADSRKGLSNDLDLAFIQATLSNPCSYCGETLLRMTLDRVNNAVGHLRSNVVPACERCNYVRRDMPAAAWQVVAAGMRSAREAGLFDGWVGGIHRRQTLPELPSIPNRAPSSEHGTLACYKNCGPPRCADCRRAMRDWQRAHRAARKLLPP